jgi:hypothetical protein
MEEEISGGTVIKRGERTQHELYDLIEMTEDLKLQKRGEDYEISYFVTLGDRMQVVLDLGENEPKGYVLSLYFEILLCSSS